MTQVALPFDPSTLSSEDQAAYIATIKQRLAETDDPDLIDGLILLLADVVVWRPQPHQRPPSIDFWMWVFQAGRGAGKTDTGANWFDKHMSGPACDPRWPGGHKGLLLGPTHGDVVASCVRGVSGLRVHNRGIELVGRKDGTFAVWPSGAEAVCLGMHTENDAERIRAQGGNTCVWWIDEAAIGRHLMAATENLALGARGSARPHGIATTTPKSTPQYKALLKMPGVIKTIGSSDDNLFLPAAYYDQIAVYRGTRLGRAEIDGELVDDYEGALWNRADIDPHRITTFPSDFIERLRMLGIVRVAIGIDPSTWIPEVGMPEVEDEYESGAGIETGLVVVGLDRRNPPHAYVLDDRSARMSAIEWSRRACKSYHDWDAAFIVPETNAGGDLVLATIHLTDPRASIFRAAGSKKPGVRAAVGKRARAEPVAALSQQGRLHMVGEFPALEATLCGWDPTLAWSPDRLDALVWAVTALEPWRKRTSAGFGVPPIGSFVR